jgi:hypothetical protein
MVSMRSQIEIGDYKDAAPAALRPPAEIHQFSLPIYPACGFRFQPLEPFDEQEEHARAEAEEHDGNAGGNAPERAGGRATIIAEAQFLPIFHFHALPKTFFNANY